MRHYINVSYRGNDAKKDRIIRNFDPEKNYGSGFCFLDNRRDFSFSCDSEDECITLVKKFRQLAKENKIRVKVSSHIIHEAIAE